MKKTISVFVIISVVFYVSALLFFGIKYKTTRDHNLKQINSQFKELKILISSVYSATNSFSSKYFKMRVHQIVKNNKRLRLIMISSSQGQIEYLYTKNRSIVNRTILEKPQTNVSKLKKPPLFYLHPLIHSYIKSPLIPINSNSYELHAIYTVVSHGELYKLVKDMFYTFVAFFIVVFIFSLYLLTATGQTALPSNMSRGISSTSKLDVSKSPKDTTSSMYSPISGVTWKEYLDVKLEDELKKADIGNYNLSLAIIKIDDFEELENREEIYLSLVKTVLNRFPAKNFVFEWDGGLALILPKTDIKQAIKKMEKLRQSIINKYYTTYKFSISIGISAKNNRDISSPQLIKETSLSLKKAISEGKNQVIAFNADPEKYAKIHPDPEQYN